MPRAARIIIPGCAQHVTRRGNNHQDAGASCVWRKRDSGRFAAGVPRKRRGSRGTARPAGMRAGVGGTRRTTLSADFADLRRLQQEILASSHETAGMRLLPIEGLTPGLFGVFLEQGPGPPKGRFCHPPARDYRQAVSFGERGNATSLKDNPCRTLGGHEYYG